MNGEQDNVSIAGRIVARRAFGKLAFLTLRDDSGTIQVSPPQLSVLTMILPSLWELSVYVNSFAILTKSLLPLLDKYHGLTHVDKRYRQRYIDMISNPEVADVFRKKARK
ncbi:lysine--tRNA ligase, chloroplastic/mitochondrial-like [Humulus lupulus]|uniref:lysine--tRNA ligase, chloroplastic/mitochondrial-like n=1 Tax=Humulus lupulus TaxID=3486 RepID=UPI002B40F0CE|nr:lysine--tRNA ligase, chloroplastic/mitochondrial-like [Humulus lupulus]